MECSKVIYTIFSSPPCVICNLGFNVLWFDLNIIQEFTIRSQPNYLFSVCSIKVHACSNCTCLHISLQEQRRNLTFAPNQREGFCQILLCSTHTRVCTNAFPRSIMTTSSTTNYCLPIHFSIIKYWPAASFWTVSLKGGKYQHVPVSFQYPSTRHSTRACHKSVTLFKYVYSMSITTPQDAHKVSAAGCWIAQCFTISMFKGSVRPELTNIGLKKVLPRIYYCLQGKVDNEQWYRGCYIPSGKKKIIK